MLDHSTQSSLSYPSHQPWPTVNLKQLFHHSQKPDSSGHASCAHSSKLLETFAKMVAPIVKRSFRFVTVSSGHITLDPPAYAVERFSGPYPVLHLNIF